MTLKRDDDQTYPDLSCLIPSSTVLTLYFCMKRYIRKKFSSGAFLNKLSMLVLGTVANLKSGVGLVILSEKIETLVNLLKVHIKLNH